MKDLKEVRSKRKPRKTSTKVIWAVVLFVAAWILVSNSFFELGENETALIMRFGEITAICVKEPSDQLTAELRETGEDNIQVRYGAGLQFKIPFVDEVVKYSSMLITYNTPAHQVITHDKKKIYFDNNAQWRIANPLRFYMAVKDVETARDRIDSLLYSDMNRLVGSMNSKTLITDKEKVEGMLEELTRQVDKACEDLGIDMFDIRIKRTDLPAEIYDSIYARMITERNRAAASYRAEGEKQALESRSITDLDVVRITSEADRKAEIMKGEGDSRAAQIFNEAYGKNPDFFEFYNLLETYKTTIGNSATMVIPLDSDFARFLLSAGVATDTAGTSG